MGRWDQQYLGYRTFPEALTSLEIERFFTPTPEELKVISQRRTAPNRIAFALQVGFLKMATSIRSTCPHRENRVLPTLYAHGAYCVRMKLSTSRLRTH